MELVTEKKVYCIKTDYLEKFGFEKGSYMYNLNIWGFTSTKIAVIKGFGLIVSYDGLDKITVEIRNELW
jgi:hypothetical protein